MAPSARAASNFFGLTSTAMIRVAPTSLAACTTARPTAPSPNTATELPGVTLVVFRTAPRPVETPQPNKEAL